MARAPHRHRRVRLDYTRKVLLATRAAKAGPKIAARARRDGRIIAAIKAAKPGVELRAEIKSWLSVRVGKPFGRITADEIAQAIA